MEYIDKDKSREWAHQLLKAFLDKCLQQNGRYPEDLYEAFKRDTEYKKGFVEKLLEDNHWRCCYCMRDIKGTTLEHMIPQSVRTIEDFQRYFEMESCLDRDNIMLAQDFLAHPAEVPPYPHTLAYENLIPSCFGYLPSRQSKCCNNYRGNNFVAPLIFRPQIHDEVKYRANGCIEWTADPEDIFPTLSKLGLDCLELKAIRRIWHYLVTHGLGCGVENKDKTIDDLLFELGVPQSFEETNMQHMLMNFKQSEYWGLLEKYTYFNNKHLFE